MSRPPTEGHALALAHLQDHPEALAPAVAEASGLSMRQARRLVAAHREAAELERAPEGRPRKWAPRVPI